MENSHIEWTDHTFNPWWGCVKVSPGCSHCYAETLSNRFTEGVWGKDAPRRFFGDGHWKQLQKWNRKAAKAGVKARVFVGSMMDIMEDRPDVQPHRERFFRIVDQTPNLIYLLLTKRPENYRRFLPKDWLSHPRPNVWLMATVEDQERTSRIDELVEGSRPGPGSERRAPSGTGQPRAG